ncbi:hypothetical protein OB919_05200 [Halobacteria archaeon AArc-curdl1]|uniref:Uncharacterized protein n=1 Tax=Natronosalvus hydrolyticus TaxID=2979988 RepID=A0AAP2Z748_9EURY|nr:hypothetical protein [Halobacteria archaeon AArc-curdl1]
MAVLPEGVVLVASSSVSPPEYPYSGTCGWVVQTTRGSKSMTSVIVTNSYRFE